MCLECEELSTTKYVSQKKLICSLASDLWRNDKNSCNGCPYDIACSDLYTLGSLISRVYTRVLVQVQLTFGHEPSSNPPMDVTIPVTIQVGGVHTGGKSRLNPGTARAIEDSLSKVYYLNNGYWF